MDGATDVGQPLPRRDRLKQLRAFCEAVRLESISGAARAVHSSQPAVSEQLRALEGELGAALLLRRGSGVVPTRAGSELYRIARPLVEGLLRVPAFFDEQYHGMLPEVLRIGVGEVSGGSVLPGFVKRFQARNPQIRIELRSGTGHERLEWLRDFTLDLVAVAIHPVPDDIAFHPLVETDAVIVTPKGHPLAGHDRVTAGELSRWPMVAPPAGRSVRQFLEVGLALSGARPRVALEVEDWGSMLNHVAAGVGIALVPEVCVAAHEPVCVVRLAHRFRLRTYGLALRRDGLASLAAHRFVEMAVAERAGGGDAG